MTTKIYTILSFKRGNRTLQSKLLGAVHDAELAIAIAESEEQRTDRKWLCEVLEFIGTRVPPRVVRPLP